MYFSKYIKRFPSDDPDYDLFYSTKKGASVLIHKAVADSLTTNGEISPSLRNTLTELGFLVDDRALEKKDMLVFLDSVNKGHRQFTATVILNLECNLNCVYCYEGDLKGRINISQETANDIISFIERQYLGQVNNIHIAFYGGEPLLSVGIMRYISAILIKAASQKGAEYSFSLTTNGTLLTKKRVEGMVSFGLKRASISLDGPREIHDKFRPFADGTGTFDIIIQNIKEVCGLIEIDITGAFTRDNYIEFPRLLDHLIAEGITPEKIRTVKFDPVIKVPKNRSEFRGGCASANEPWLSEVGMFLREEILKRGFKTLRMEPSACRIEIDNNIVINHDGSILKCPAFMGFDGLDAGNVKTGIKDYHESHKLDIWKREECLDCEYLPMCYGGCRYLKLLRDGHIDGVDCKKPQLDATLETLVKQDLKYSLRI